MYWGRYNDGNKMRLLKKILLTLSLCVLMTAPAVTGASAVSFNSARTVAVSTGDACEGLQQLGGTNCPQNGGNPQGKIGSLAKSVVEIISYIAGVAAIIMIVVSGIKYTTSGGDSAQVSSAKTTLIYALIGVAVASLAQFMVHFILNRTT
jgi:hypothetical protein